MGVIYKKGREISDSRVATNSLVLDTEDLVSSVDWFIVKSTVVATTPKILGVSKTAQTFDSDNQTVWEEKVVYVTIADDLRLKLATTADLAIADVGDLYSLNSSQDVISTVAWTQVELIEVLDTRVGSFKVL